MKKRYPLIFIALALSACTAQAPDPAAGSPAIADQAALLGIWAMIPLRNGIANVVEYSPDGKAALHPFNCAEPGPTQEVEMSSYTLAKDGKSIHIESPKNAFDLQVVTAKPNAMALAMTLSGQQLAFIYLKVKKVVPLCFMYTPAGEEQKKSPYQTTDFVPAPSVPSHADLGRYLGQWADDKGEVQFEVRQDKMGNAYLYHSRGENWVYMFNTVAWEQDGLHFTTFAYSDKPNLYKHPYHKSKTPAVISVNEDGTLKHVYFILGQRFESTLFRKPDQ
ncbi:MULTISPECIES: hypothetical protein [Pseudomonas]|uniref:Lipoprotein n=1 Tax=Pseudomonas quercus TaxID=2722792 RepID=A0ABX0YB52_9PSED|nr:MULTISPECIES: hypothetical protein [Pseudomonas]MBF7140977.1 hypothetical protein [Pseudomonas sp. LY10J]NJO99511.1 hypothetical protein [Pseudomonas quercus]